ncbi:nucleotidyltransferase family protein [Desulfosporosinus sp.]|uniref:nucleotidyltransferase family protein n=1 Tax=Desulfosporosinus sp. TaxID=157907 RepID=UPI0025C6881B|nr:nucleotidyltransferase family protein [Desulfosporosinus sp.]MBC2721566.1 nucleotidyltransferase family protein [Desulfosporosinus sp.]MBC2727022.1 nucleotidyltransferase family protein [Desulfosporosinus sp.]
MVRFVVMAAGLASRMGRDKLALPWKETTVLGYVLQTVLEAIKLQEHNSPQCRIEVHVVSRQPIGAYVSDEGITEFERYGGIWHDAPSSRPLAETIRIGLQNLKKEVHSLAFLPGDQVGITVQDLSGCLDVVLRSFPDFLVPIAGDKAGSPVFFHKRYLPELLELQGEQGGKVVLNRYPDRWYKYPVEESLFCDVDTPEQYEALSANM